MKAAPVFLLVEPSPILRSSFHDWLDQVFAGHRILTAANGVEALRLAKEQQPSHILIEIDLTQPTGVEVLQELRLILPDAKIVATGWYDSRFLRQSVLLAGADEYIRKNKVPSELLPLWDLRLK